MQTYGVKMRSGEREKQKIQDVCVCVGGLKKDDERHNNAQ